MGDALCWTDRIVASEQIQRILTEAVGKVVLEVSYQRAPAVLKDPLLGPLAGPGEVGLEGPGARLLDADHVGVVSPHILEQVLEHGLMLHPGVLPEHPEPDQRRLQVVPGQHDLDHVGCVQTVDAVCPEDPALSSEHQALSGQDKVAELLLVLGQSVHQSLQLVVSHLAALFVEIKGLVEQICIRHLVTNGLELSLQSTLCTLLVD